MEKSVTHKQLPFILIGTMIGYGAISLPKNICQISGTAAWISLIFTSFIAVLFAYFTFYVINSFRNQTIFEYGKTLLGNFFGSLVIYIYIVYFFMIAAFEMRAYAEGIKQTILIHTPIWAINLLFLIVICYSLSSGISTIGKIAQFYITLVVLSILTIHILIFTKGEVINLRPFLGTKPFYNYIIPTPKIILPYLGFETFFTIPINDKNSKHLIRNNILTIFFVSFLFILITESCLSLMGIDDIVYYKLTTIVAVRRLNLHYLEFLSRLDSVFIIGISAAVFCIIMIYSHSCLFLVSKVIPKIKFNALNVITVILVYIVSLLPKDINQADKLLSYTAYLGMFTAGIMPLTFYIICKIKKKKSS